MIKSIKKRDGRIVAFEREKIEQAIENCFMASGTRKTQETAKELTGIENEAVLAQIVKAYAAIKEEI